jgi:hypothetical protein
MTLHTATQSMPYEICALSLAARGIVERRLALAPKQSVINVLGMGRPSSPLTPAPRPALATYARRS